MELYKMIRKELGVQRNYNKMAPHSRQLAGQKKRGIL
jgi:hypothetical protein